VLKAVSDSLLIITTTAAATATVTTTAAATAMASQLQKRLIKDGNKADYPKPGDEVTIEYTGWLYDAGAASNQYRGSKYGRSRLLPARLPTTRLPSSAKSY